MDEEEQERRAMHHDDATDDGEQPTPPGTLTVPDTWGDALELTPGLRVEPGVVAVLTGYVGVNEFVLLLGRQATADVHAWLGEVLAA